MNCLFCDKPIKKYNLYSLIMEDDYLCNDCRNQLSIEKNKLKINDLIIETFFEYDSIYKSLLIQYKECCDEALSKVFLYKLNDYINIKYRGYKLLFVPSSKEKQMYRGFNHLELMFKNVKLDKIDGLLTKQDLIQENKNYSERSMMLGNYEYVGGRLNKVLIVDDVLTTGSSMIGVYNTIKPYANDIKGLCLAVKRKRFHFVK